MSSRTKPAGVFTVTGLTDGAVLVTAEAFARLRHERGPAVLPTLVALLEERTTVADIRVVRGARGIVVGTAADFGAAA